MEDNKVSTGTIREYLGQKITASFILREVREEASQKTRWLRLVLCDADGTMEARIWQDCMRDEYPAMAGSVVKVTGDVRDFRGSVQLSVETMERDTETDIAEFVPSYSAEEADAAYRKTLQMIRESESEAAKFAEFLLTSMAGNSARYCNIRNGKVNGFYNMAAELLEAARSVYALSQKKAEIGMVFAILVSLMLGIRGAMKFDGALIAKKEDAFLIGYGVNALLLQDFLIRKYKYQISREVLIRIQHGCLAGSGKEDPKTPEAEFARTVMAVWEKLMKEGQYGQFFLS